MEKITKILVCLPTAVLGVFGLANGHYAIAFILLVGVAMCLGSDGGGGYNEGTFRE